MNLTMFTSKKYDKGLIYDARTKLVLLITMLFLIFGGSYQNELYYLPAIIPLIVTLSAKRYTSCIVYTLTMGIALLSQWLVIPLLTGFSAFILTPIIIISIYFAPSFLLSHFLVTTTTISELIATMEKFKLPKQVTIPMAVLFRFFPTISEEWKVIGDAMKMRGIRLKGNKMGAMLEYRIITMLLCTVKIGEELSCASLTRGLGGPVKRTNICELHFKLQDIVILIICVLCIVFQIIIFFKGAII